MDEKKRATGEAPGGRRVGRREAIAGAAGLAGLFALGAWAKADAESASRAEATAALVRPPGARDEKSFLALCLRCDRCRSVCHTGVIGTADFSTGILRMRTPVLNFRLGRCDFCGKCAEVCPTGAIESFDKETAKAGLAELTESCIALRTGACRVCHEKCPYDAITLNAQNVPVIHADACNGCGLCEEVCPANVFQSYRTGRARGIVVRPVGRTRGNVEGAEGSAQPEKKEGAA